MRVPSGDQPGRPSVRPSTSAKIRCGSPPSARISQSVDVNGRWPRWGWRTNAIQRPSGDTAADIASSPLVRRVTSWPSVDTANRSVAEYTKRSPCRSPITPVNTSRRPSGDHAGSLTCRNGPRSATGERRPSSPARPREVRPGTCAMTARAASSAGTGSVAEPLVTGESPPASPAITAIRAGNRAVRHVVRGIHCTISNIAHALWSVEPAVLAARWSTRGTGQVLRRPRLGFPTRTKAPGFAAHLS